MKINFHIIKYQRMLIDKMLIFKINFSSQKLFKNYQDKYKKK